MRTMKAVVYSQPGRANASIKEIPYPDCGSHDVIIKVMASGICKPAESSHDKNGSILGRYPAVPGHEFAGIVEEVGTLVTTVQKGDRVTADNGVPCGKCFYCKNNQPVFCEEFGSMGHNLQGSMAQYIAVPEKNVYHLPGDISFDEACLSELVTCCLRAVERSSITYGENVAILGAGASGMILAQLFKNSYAGEVAILDSVESKLNIMSKKGIKTYLVDRNEYQNTVGKICCDFPYGFDIIVDATGSVDFVETMLACLKKGGRFIGYSFPSTMRKHVPIDMSKFIINEWTYLGTSFKYTFSKSRDVIVSKKIDLISVITNSFTLDQYFKALDKNLQDQNEIKIIIHPNN